MAPYTGILGRIAQAEGSVVPVGGLLGLEHLVSSSQDHTTRNLILAALYMVALVVIGVLLYLQHVHHWG